MRADYAFHFFRHGITRPTLVATSNAGAPNPNPTTSSLAFEPYSHMCALVCVCACVCGCACAVTFVNYNEPMQGRLMLTGRQNEMRVMWTTRDAVRPQVKFGTSPGMCIPHLEHDVHEFLN
jgi:hypothetical protein